MLHRLALCRHHGAGQGRRVCMLFEPGLSCAPAVALLLDGRTHYLYVSAGKLPSSLLHSPLTAAIHPTLTERGTLTSNVTDPTTVVTFPSTATTTATAATTRAITAVSGNMSRPAWRAGIGTPETSKPSEIRRAQSGNMSICVYVCMTYVYVF